MDAIIGRYRARMEEEGLLLKHPSGIHFEFTLDETVALLDLLTAYRQTLLSIQQESEHDTEPRIERVVLEKSMQDPEYR